jgi:hypothetical protein
LTPAARSAAQSHGAGEQRAEGCRSPPCVHPCATHTFRHAPQPLLAPVESGGRREHTACCSLPPVEGSTLPTGAKITSMSLTTLGAPHTTCTGLPRPHSTCAINTSQAAGFECWWSVQREVGDALSALFPPHYQHHVPGEARAQVRRRVGATLPTSLRSLLPRETHLAHAELIRLGVLSHGQHLGHQQGRVHIRSILYPGAKAAFHLQTRQFSTLKAAAYAMSRAVRRWNGYGLMRGVCLPTRFHPTTSHPSGFTYVSRAAQG